jgi:mono/diheme cytochrome c family protein
MRAALAVIAVVVFVVHGIVFYDQFFARWQDYQAQYFQRAHDLSDDGQVKATLAARRPAVEQVIVRSFGPERVDRCTTCHIAVEDPRFTDVDQPLRTHPPLPPGHKFDTFGCTICHDGQGRAVDMKAHADGENWPWPVLPKQMIEANCVQCHGEQNFAGAPKVWQGRRLFFERACYTCHTIRDLSYGSVGPELTAVGRTRQVEFVVQKIEDPRVQNPVSTMPKQDLSPEQVEALATFLKAQQGSNIARAPLQAFRSTQSGRPEWLPVALIVGPEAEAIEKLDPVRQGEALVARVGCLSCHRLDERDGKVGPDLAFTSAQRDHGWIMAHFEDPKSLVPGSVMPPYPLPETIFDSLSRYLESRSLPALAAEPAARYTQLCARCHGEAGAADGVIAPYVEPRPRDLTKAAFMRTKTRERLVASVVDGVAGTSMAPWGKVLGQAGSEALVDYVLASLSKGSGSPPKVARAVPEKNPVPFSNESAARGEAVYLNRCWGCHGKKADGNGPNAADIVPRPRNLRNGPFVRSVSYARLHESIKYGVQGTAMPAAGFDFALDDETIGDLVNYVLAINGLASETQQARNPVNER